MASRARTQDACLRGAFADLIPAHRPTLLDLANRMLVAQDIMREASDKDWNAASDAEFDATKAFKDALTHGTGIPMLVWERLGLSL
jgi:hypothetical protein